MALQDTLDQLKSLDVSELDVNNIGAWPAAIKGLVISVIFALVLAGGYFFYLTDKQTALEQAEQKETSLKSEIEDKWDRAANLEDYTDQMAEMEERFGALLRQLPKDTEVPGLLEDITLTALDNGLQIESIDLQAERRDEVFIELPMTITVTGEYHDIGSFVSGVANLSRIVTLHDFTITPQGSPTNLKMTILAKTYRYLEDGGK